VVLRHCEGGHAENPTFNARKALFRVALRNRVFTHGAIQGLPDSVAHGTSHQRSLVGEREHVGVFPHVVSVHPSQGEMKIQLVFFFTSFCFPLLLCLLVSIMFSILLVSDYSLRSVDLSGFLRVFIFLSLPVFSFLIQKAYRLDMPDPRYNNPMLPQWTKLMKDITVNRIKRKRTREVGFHLTTLRAFKVLFVCSILLFDGSFSFCSNRILGSCYITNHPQSL